MGSLTLGLFKPAFNYLGRFKGRLETPFGFWAPKGLLKVKARWLGKVNSGITPNFFHSFLSISFLGLQIFWLFYLGKRIFGGKIGVLKPIPWGLNYPGKRRGGLNFPIGWGFVPQIKGWGGNGDSFGPKFN